MRRFYIIKIRSLLDDCSTDLLAAIYSALKNMKKGVKDHEY